MSTKTNTLAKSLHTITALHRVARLIQSYAQHPLGNDDAMTQALRALGYGTAADPYNLAGKALATMNAEDAATAAPRLSIAC